MKKLAVSAVLAVAAAVAHGQFQLGFDSLYWVQSSFYASQLKLTDAQKALIQLPENLKLKWKSKDDPVKERTAWLKQAYVQFANSLSTEQRDMLFSFHVERLGIRAFFDDELCHRLALTEEQTASIRGMLQPPVPNSREIVQRPYGGKAKNVREQLEINAWSAERSYKIKQDILDRSLETWVAIRAAMRTDQWRAFADLRGDPRVGREFSVESRMQRVLTMSKTARELLGCGDDFMHVWSEAYGSQDRFRPAGETFLRHSGLLDHEQLELLRRITFQVLGESAAFKSDVKDVIGITEWQKILAGLATIRTGAWSTMRMRQDDLRTLYVTQLPTGDSLESRAYTVTRWWTASVMNASRRIRTAGRANLILRDVLTDEQQDMLREMRGEPIVQIWKVRAELEHI